MLRYVMYCIFADNSSSLSAFVNLFWPICLGGCNLRRNTGKWLREAGPWTSVDLVEPVDQAWFKTLPRVTGILTK